MSRRRPLDREAVVQALDAQIMALLSIKAMVMSVDDHDDDEAAGEQPEGPCPERANGEPHEIVWTGAFGTDQEQGMCRYCASTWTVGPDESPGVSSPDPL